MNFSKLIKYDFHVHMINLVLQIYQDQPYRYTTLYNTSGMPSCSTLGSQVGTRVGIWHLDQKCGQVNIFNIQNYVSLIIGPIAQSLCFPVKINIFGISRHNVYFFVFFVKTDKLKNSV